MKVVITGGRGFIGTNLAIHLRNRFPDVHLLSVDSFAGAVGGTQATYDENVIACFAAPTSLERYVDADVVVHLAARTTVQESVDDPMSTFRENVAKTQTMLEYLRINAPNAKLIFASTGGAIVGEHKGAINETINPRPLSPYGASKLAVEGLMSAYAGSFGLKSVSLRFSNVYGPNSLRMGSVVAAFCKQLAQSNTVQVNGDGHQTRDYIHVGDVAEAVALVIESPSACGVYQLGTGVETSINELVEIFTEVLSGHPPSVVYGPALNGEVRHNRCDITRIKTELGFSPQWKLRDGVQATWDWFENFRSMPSDG